MNYNIQNNLIYVSVQILEYERLEIKDDYPDSSIADFYDDKTNPDNDISLKLTKVSTFLVAFTPNATPIKMFVNYLFTYIYSAIKFLATKSCVVTRNLPLFSLAF